MLRILPISLILAGIGLCSHAAEPVIKRENIEWTQIWIPNATQTDLPRVLLIGDSICNAYYDGVAQRIDGKATAAKLATSSSLGDPALLEQVELLLKNYKFDVIHFNNGLHGFEYTEAEYQTDIPKLLAIFQKYAPQAKIIWATSTPMRKTSNLQEFNPENERVVARNKIVEEAAAKNAIPLNDLYSLVENHPEYWSADGIHFNADGQAAEAEQVARHILEVLKP